MIRTRHFTATFEQKQIAHADYLDDLATAVDDAVDNISTRIAACPMINEATAEVEALIAKWRGIVATTKKTYGAAAAEDDAERDSDLPRNAVNGQAFCRAMRAAREPVC